MPIDIEKLRIKRGRPPLQEGEAMHQMSLRIPRWMIEEIDLINEHERFNQSDRATLIRELLARGLDDYKAS